MSGWKRGLFWLRLSTYRLSAASWPPCWWPAYWLESSCESLLGLSWGQLLSSRPVMPKRDEKDRSVRQVHIVLPLKPKTHSNSNHSFSGSVGHHISLFLKYKFKPYMRNAGLFVAHLIVLKLTQNLTQKYSKKPAKISPFQHKSL